MTQVVFAYLAGGWMVLAVIDQVVDREVLPLVVYEAALTLYLVGIVGALIVGWYHGELGEQRAPLREIVMLSIVGVIALGASGQVVRRAMQESTLTDAIDEADLRRIAVLYLEDMSRDGSMNAVAERITEGLIENLSGVREVQIRSRNASRQARDLGDVGVDSIAELLEVGAVIDGTVDQRGDDISVSIRLLEGQTGQPIFRETYSWPAQDVAGVSTVLASEVAQALRQEIGGEIRLREARASAPNSAAWLQVARAESFLKEADRALLDGDGHAVSEALENADTELAAAQESAPEWAEPLVLRSRAAYESYVLADDVDELLATLDLAVTYATEALQIDPSSAGALEWRGTARYRRWLSRADDGAAADDLLAQAQADLERSETLDPSRASVPSTLSHLYYQIDDWTNAVLKARTAYEQDAFLDVIDGVLWRLYTASYDLEDYDTAQEWCEAGNERFPHNFRFVQCQIYLMTMPGAEPDVARAWVLLDEMIPLLTERPEYHEAQARMMIGGIIGRAGMPDSAQAVFSASAVNTEVDPDREVMGVEAAMRSVIGDIEGAIATLERFMVASSDRAPGRHWWWANLEGNPAFERLQALH